MESSSSVTGNGGEAASASTSTCTSVGSPLFTSLQSLSLNARPSSSSTASQDKSSQLNSSNGNASLGSTCSTSMSISMANSISSSSPSDQTFLTHHHQQFIALINHPTNIQLDFPIMPAHQRNMVSPGVEESLFHSFSMYLFQAFTFFANCLPFDSFSSNNQLNSLTYLQT